MSLDLHNRAQFRRLERMVGRLERRLHWTTFGLLCLAVANVVWVVFT